MMDDQHTIRYIVNWINQYLSNMPKPAESLIVGISGGIDSSLTSTLASMTGVKTFAVSMPINTNTVGTNLGHVHGKWLEEKFSNTNLVHIDLTSTYKIFNSTICNVNQKSDLGFANSKSRLRMVTLYQVAAAQNGIVVGTGNKVEDFGVGFYTKYGDGGVDIAPIADLMKSEVKSLSQSLGIDQRIIEAAPRDGLWDDDRTDETQLGLSYDELEDAMINAESGNRQKYDSIRKNNLHKMLPIPVCKIPRS